MGQPDVFIGDFDAARKINLHKAPGVSEFLTGEKKIAETRFPRLRLKNLFVFVLKSGFDFYESDNESIQNQ